MLVVNGKPPHYSSFLTLRTNTPLVALQAEQSFIPFCFSFFFFLFFLSFECFFSSAFVFVLFLQLLLGLLCLISHLCCFVSLCVALFSVFRGCIWCLWIVSVIGFIFSFGLFRTRNE